MKNSVLQHASYIRAEEAPQQVVEGGGCEGCSSRGVGREANHQYCCKTIWNTSHYLSGPCPPKESYVRLVDKGIQSRQGCVCISSLRAFGAFYNTSTTSSRQASAPQESARLIPWQFLMESFPHPSHFLPQSKCLLQLQPQFNQLQLRLQFNQLLFKQLQFLLYTSPATSAIF